jgi:hypothetical protein
MSLGANIITLNAVNIVAAQTYYTRSIDIGSYGSNFGVFALGTSVAGAPNWTLQYEESYTPPATELAADSNWVIPNGVPALFTNRVAETAFIDEIPAVPMRYLRFKITTDAASNADSLFTIVIFIVEG